MSNSVSKKLTLLEEIIKEGTIEDALKLINDIEQMEILTPEENVKILRYKSSLYLRLQQYDVVFKLSDEIYQISEKLKSPLFLFDALGIKASAYYHLGRFEEFYKYLEQSEESLNTIPREESQEFKRREAILMYCKGVEFLDKGNFNLALEYHNKSLELIKHIDLLGPFGLNYNNISEKSYVYFSKGEINFALKCAEKALSLIPKGEYHIQAKGNIYRILGNIYEEKGNLDKAFKYQLKAFKINKKFPFFIAMSFSYYNVISLLLAKKDLNQAFIYLEEFKEYTEKINRPLSNMYRIAHAMLLKTGSTKDEQNDAKSQLKQIIKEDYNIFTTTMALIHLCGWYLEDFRNSNQMDILDDIHALIEHLERNVRQSNSYYFLVNTKLFQAKLALIQIDMFKARQILTEAQRIAEEHGLQLLAGEISKEHDRLLEELKVWESIKKPKPTISDRLKLVSIDDTLERLQRRRAIEPSELIREEPILLIVMDNSGVPYFNHSFGSDWDIDGIFSAFMSAFNTFSTELFSKSIDRIKIGENIILINPIEPFLACYVIKGQSYPAQQKLTRFSATIKETTEIWEALNRAAKTSEMLELDNPPSLGSTVNEIFNN